MSRLDIAIVVVTFNSAGLLDDFLAALPASDGFGWQLVVADNASHDGTVERLRQLAPDSIVVEMGRNAGYAAGINAAVEAAGERDAYLVLNPDVRLHPSCVDTLLEVLYQPGVGIAVPHLVDGQGSLILSMRREPSVVRALGDLLVGAERAGRIHGLSEIVSSRHHYEQTKPTDWAEGSTQLISRACWEACGPWDESFFLYSEEAEFDLRARDRGFATLYVASAHAVHLEGGSATSPALWALLQVNRVRLFRQRNGPGATMLFWSALVLRELTRTCLGRATSRAALTLLLRRQHLAGPAGPWSIEPHLARARQHQAAS